MSFLESALELASLGFHVFPLAPQSKEPILTDFPHRATTDPETIKKWWIDPVLNLEQPFNIGISTSRFGDGALLVIDVDNKNDKKGSDELERIRREGKLLPETFEQHTPTGGVHLVFRTRVAVKQGVDVLGRGLDVRSRGGYIVGAGSSASGGTYTCVRRHLADAPEWLSESCGRGVTQEPGYSELSRENLAGVDPVRARARAEHYLEHDAPVSIKGEGGDQTAYRVAARVKDFGVDAATCLDLMLGPWNEKSGWAPDRLKEKVEHAYRYGIDPVGASAPEVQFPLIEDPVPEVPFPLSDPAPPEPGIHPFDEMNKRCAYIAGNKGFIIEESTDLKGRVTYHYVDLQKFHTNEAPWTMNFGGRTQPVSKLWINSGRRRQYRDLCFSPEKEPPLGMYNLWKGFAFAPPLPGEEATPRTKDALAAFLEHAEKNICGGDLDLTHWLLSWIAHLFQKPWEKPLTAIIFRGKKGVGKNALIERVGALLARNSMVVTDPRYLTGNFNSHLENKLLLTLDEAFWSGDAKAAGILKGLVTGTEHVIEHKGKEPFQVTNLTRVAILGNEAWLVPASEEERRYAVFDVGEGRQRDLKFFREMREGFEAGGYPFLLRYFLDYDMKDADPNAAPSTEALHDQKISGLKPFSRWWYDCLTEGRVLGSDFEGWPESIEKDRLRRAFLRYADEQKMSGWRLTSESFGKLLRHQTGSTFENVRAKLEGSRVHFYRFPPLPEARKLWDGFIGHETAWEMTDEEMELFE